MLARIMLALLCGAIVLVVAVLGTCPTTPLDPGSNNASLVACGDRVLSRQRRYIVFPRGSSLNLVYCFSHHGYIPFTNMFVFGLTAGLSWQLPNEAHQVYIQRRAADRHPDREHRANLYQSVKTFLAQRGLEGEECVQRTICESSRPRKDKGTFIEELISVFFNFPEGDSYSKTTWDSARYNGQPCEARFARCSSVLDIALPTKARK